MGNCNKKDGSRDFISELQDRDGKDRKDSFAFIDEVQDDDGTKKYHIRPKNEAQASNDMFDFEK